MDNSEIENIPYIRASLFPLDIHQIERSSLGDIDLFLVDDTPRCPLRPQSGETDANFRPSLKAECQI